MVHDAAGSIPEMRATSRPPTSPLKPAVKVPLVHSPTKAGAVSSVYSSPAQIGDQGGRLAARWSSARGELPAAMHAAEFSLAFNSHVARSLGVHLAEEAAIRAALGAAHDP